jgi:hypothetical protein
MRGAKSQERQLFSATEMGAVSEVNTIGARMRICMHLFDFKGGQAFSL